MLLVLSGLQGCGKSRLAGFLKDKLNAQLFNSDVVRKELFSNPKYTEEETEKVYDYIFNMSEEMISKGQVVILDAVFFKDSLRKKALSITSDSHLIEVICPEEIVKDRLEKRTNDVSDAGYDIYLEYKLHRYEAIKEEHFILDSSKDLENEVEKLLKYISNKKNNGL